MPRHNGKQPVSKVPGGERCPSWTARGLLTCGRRAACLSHEGITRSVERARRDVELGAGVNRAADRQSPRGAAASGQPRSRTLSAVVGPRAKSGRSLRGGPHDDQHKGSKLGGDVAVLRRLRRLPPLPRPMQQVEGKASRCCHNPGMVRAETYMTPLFAKDKEISNV